MDSFFFLSPPSPDLLGADMIFLGLFSEINALMFTAGHSENNMLFIKISRISFPLGSSLGVGILIEKLSEPGEILH